MKIGAQRSCLRKVKTTKFKTTKFKGILYGTVNFLILPYMKKFSMMPTNFPMFDQLRNQIIYVKSIYNFYSTT